MACCLTLSGDCRRLLRRARLSLLCLRSRVTEEEIAEVVSKWTGIPIAKMLEGDREKLLRIGGDAASACRGAR